MVRDRAMLPEVCLVTGVPAAAGWDPPQWLTFTWAPRWIRWMSEWSWPVLMFMPLGYAFLSHRAAPILMPLWILPIGFLINRGEKWVSKNPAVLCSFSPAVVREGRRQVWLRLAVLPPLLAAATFPGMERWNPGGSKLWGSNAGFLAALGTFHLILLLSKAWVMRPVAVGHRDGWFRVRNCHPAFLNLLPEEMPPLAEVRRPAPPVVPGVHPGRRESPAPFRGER